jgi:hypothetical protein
MKINKYIYTVLLANYVFICRPKWKMHLLIKNMIVFAFIDAISTYEHLSKGVR